MKSVVIAAIGSFFFFQFTEAQLPKRFPCSIIYTQQYGFDAQCFRTYTSDGRCSPAAGYVEKWLNCSLSTDNCNYNLSNCSESLSLFENWCRSNLKGTIYYGVEKQDCEKSGDDEDDEGPDPVEPVDDEDDPDDPLFKS